MVDINLFKTSIMNLFNQETSIEFLGTHFEKNVFLLTEKQYQEILLWLRNISERLEPEIRAKTNKKYKGYLTKELIVFRKRLSIAGVTYRILLVKVKNSFYLEFHLGKHNYYDTTRKKLGLKFIF